MLCALDLSLKSAVRPRVAANDQAMAATDKQDANERLQIAGVAPAERGRRAGV